MTEILAFVTTAALFGTIGLIAWIYWKVSEWNYDRKAKRQRELYPELYELRDEANEINSQRAHYLKKIIEIKEKIDNLINQTKYAIPSDKEKIEKELNDLRFELKDNEELLAPLEKKIKELWTKYEEMIAELKNKGIKIY